MTIDWTKVEPGKTVLESPEGDQLLVIGLWGHLVWWNDAKRQHAGQHTQEYFDQDGWTIREEWENHNEKEDGLTTV